MNRTLSLLLAGMGALVPLHAHAADSPPPPGVQALDAFRHPDTRSNPVMNRFFIKTKRFEITPLVGFVPNNAFASRFTINLGLGYHFSEQLSLQAFLSYAPDLGKRDVKSLVPALLQQATDTSFQQPLEKTTLSGAIGVQWAPVYGKISILGEVVANFDFYIFAGMGIAVQNQYYATRAANPVDLKPSNYFDLTSNGTQVRAMPTLALGANFFLTQAVAIRLDGRMGLIIDDKPQYDINNPEPGMRALTEFNTSIGVAIFIPKMKPRLKDF